MNNKIFEWAGVITAILYSLFVAMNIGIEFFGFCLLLISAILIGILNINFSENKKSDLLFNEFPSQIKSLQWHSYEVKELDKIKDITLLASSPETKYQIFKYQNHAYGIQFHIEIKDTTVGEWGCVPEYKSALEKQLGKGALEKFDLDAKNNMSNMNKYSKILYENFKKLLKTL